MEESEEEGEVEGDEDEHPGLQTHLLSIVIKCSAQKIPTNHK